MATGDGEAHGARVSILGMDAGGTMTDTIAVDERGEFKDEDRFDEYIEVLGGRRPSIRSATP